jgi:hypothetical protein
VFDGRASYQLPKLPIHWLAEVIIRAGIASRLFGSTRRNSAFSRALLITAGMPITLFFGIVRSERTDTPV